eukprot:scaffold673107_cov43-Prasinocladus_malaysianus.AAC.1
MGQTRAAICWGVFVRRAAQGAVVGVRPPSPSERLGHLGSVFQLIRLEPVDVVGLEVESAPVVVQKLLNRRDADRRGRGCLQAKHGCEILAEVSSFLHVHVELHRKPPIDNDIRERYSNSAPSRCRIGATIQ